MTAVLSGTNGLLQSYDYQVLTTGFGYTFAAGVQVLVIQPAGTLATGTITMPASPADGMTITVESTQQITALTMSGNGGTIVGAAVQLIPNQPLSWVYRLANTTWYPLWGGAGRATALVSGTAVASTSGTSIDFTGIPSWVKRITVVFNGVSTNGTNAIRVQLGDSGGFETSGYSGVNIRNSASTLVFGSISAGFDAGGALAALDYRGTLVLSLQNLSTNTWIGLLNLTAAAAGATPDNQIFQYVCGSKATSATLDSIRITTVGSTDTFDAGSINILYE